MQQGHALVTFKALVPLSDDNTVAGIKDDLTHENSRWDTASIIIEEMPWQVDVELFTGDVAEFERDSDAEHESDEVEEEDIDDDEDDDEEDDEEDKD